MDLDPFNPSECARNSHYYTPAETQMRSNSSPITIGSSANIEEPGHWEDSECFRVTKRSARADWPSGYHQSKSIKSCEDAMPQFVSIIERVLYTGPD